MNVRFDATRLTPTLPLQIADLIGARVADGSFSEAERLKEVELATAFRVSRATIREALRILETRGLVTITPQRGAQVTAFSVEEMEDLFEIRAVLLALVSQKVAERPSTERDNAIRDGLLTLDAARGRLTEYLRASAAMVALIGRLSRNLQLAQMNDTLAKRIGRYVRLGLASPGRRDQSFRRWKQIVEAILRNDGGKAGELHRTLVMENCEVARREVARKQSGRNANDALSTRG